MESANNAENFLPDVAVTKKGKQATGELATGRSRPVVYHHRSVPFSLTCKSRVGASDFRFVSRVRLARIRDSP